MTTANGRVDWVDYAKGFCIIMVVMMHSTLGVEKAAGAEGWMHYVVAWAAPFRMPDFFMIAGLFLSRVIDKPWSRYLDSKVVHFAYFYALWVTIQFVFKAPGMIAEGGVGAAAEAYLLAYIEPFGTMWFIYMLPIMFVVTKLLRRVPWPIVWLAAAALEMAEIHTGWILIDEFASRFVYFYSGYIFAPWIFVFASRAMPNGWATAGLLVGWAVLNGIVVFTGYSTTLGISLALGFVGALAVVAFSVLLSKSDLLAPVRYAGQHSLVVYLAFFLPMAITRTLLLKTGVITDLGTISLIVTIVAVVTPLLLFWAVRGTPARFLFERPRWARLDSHRRTNLVPAE